MLSLLSEVPTMRMPAYCYSSFRKSVSVSLNGNLFLECCSKACLKLAKRGIKSNYCCGRHKVEGNPWKKMLRWSLGSKLRLFFNLILFIFYLFYKKRCRQPIRMCLTLAAVFSVGGNFWALLHHLLLAAQHARLSCHMITCEDFFRTGPMTST